MQTLVSDANGTSLFIDLQQIVSIRREGKHLYFRSESDTYHLSDSIYEYASVLEQHRFMRIHSNTIINMDKVTGYDHKHNLLHFPPCGSEGITTCEVSRNNRTKVKNYLILRDYNK